jgi:hypothetical protein
MQPTASLAELLPVQGCVSAEHERLSCFCVDARILNQFLTTERRLYAFQNGISAVS